MNKSTFLPVIQLNVQFFNRRPDWVIFGSLAVSLVYWCIMLPP